MAVRKVSIRLAVEGEKEYREAITQINSELRKMQSALKLVASEFLGQANTVEALTAKQKALSDLYNTQAAKLKIFEDGLKNAQKAEENYAKQKEDLTKRIEENEKALNDFAKTGQTAGKEQAALATETERLKKELADNEKYLEAAQKGTNNWERDLNNAKIELNKTNAEITKNDKYLEEARNSADGAATSIDEYGKEIKKAGEKTKEFSDETKGAVEAMASTLVAAGIKKTFEEIVDVLYDAITASREFESALTGVAKTTNMTGKPLEDMSDRLKQMSLDIPEAANDLAGIAEIAGQLGMRGERELAVFTEVIAKLGSATDLTGESAATMLAKFGAYTDLPLEQYSNLGSAITALGNNSRTSESKILELSIGIASAGDRAGMSEADILGLSTVLSSMGIESARGATNMSKLIRAMDDAVITGEKLDEFAAASGLTAGEFATAWRNNAADALVTFVDGLNATVDAGGSLTSVLTTLGIKEEHMTRSIEAFVNSREFLNDTLELSRVAFEEDIALQEEASQRYETTDSKVQILHNSINLLAIEVGDQLKPAFDSFVAIGTDAVQWATDFVSNNEAIIPLVTALATGMGVLAVGIVANTTIIQSALLGLKAAIDTATGGVTLIISALVALAALMITMPKDETSETIKRIGNAAKESAENVKEINEKYNESVDAARAAAIEAGTYIDRLSALESQGKLTTAEQREYNALVSNLKELLPDVNFQIDEQTGLLVDGAEALRDWVDIMKQQAEAEAGMEKMTELTKDRAEVVIKLQDGEKKRLELLDDLNQKEQDGADLLEQINEKAKERNEIDQDGNILMDEKNIKIAEIDHAMIELNAAYVTNIEEQERLNEQLGKTDDAIESAEGAVEGLDGEIDELAESMTKTSIATEETQGAFEAFGDVGPEFADTAQSIQVDIDNLIRKQQALATSIHEETMKYVTSLKGLDKDVEVTTDVIMGRWDEIGEKYQKYTDGLILLTESGISGDLVEHWSDGSEESIVQVLALSDELKGLGATTENTSKDAEKLVNEMNTSFKKVDGIVDNYSNNASKMEKDFRENADKIAIRIGELINEMDKADAATISGRSTAEGYIGGMMSQADALFVTGQKMFDKVQEGYKSRGEIKSPSQRAKRAGFDHADGFLVAYEAKMNELKRKGEQMFDAVNEGYSVASTNAMKNIVSNDTTNINNIRTTNYGGDRTINAPINITIHSNMDDDDIRTLAEKVGREFRAQLPV